MKTVTLVCVECKKQFERSLQRYNQNSKRGSKNSFCTPECQAKWSDCTVTVSCGSCRKTLKRERKEVKKSKSGLLFCNKSCAAKHNNALRTGIVHPNFTGGSNSETYRKICFAYHPKKCLVCDETLIVDVHHYDENRTNNEPSNLLPLCPTHHRYWHSPYKYIVEATITGYRERFIEFQSDFPVSLFEEEFEEAMG